MVTINQVTLLGNVGKDPDVRSLSNGSKVANFSMATSEPWRDKQTGEWREKTDWHNIVVWSRKDSDGLVGVVDKYVRKGSKLYVQGKLQTRMWEKDNVKHYTTEVVLQGYDSKLVLLDGKDRDSGPRADDRVNTSTLGSSRRLADEMEDIIPF